MCSLPCILWAGSIDPRISTSLGTRVSFCDIYHIDLWLVKRAPVRGPAASHPRNSFTFPVPQPSLVNHYSSCNWSHDSPQPHGEPTALKLQSVYVVLISKNKKHKWYGLSFLSSSIGLFTAFPVFFFSRLVQHGWTTFLRTICHYGKAFVSVEFLSTDFY